MTFDFRAARTTMVESQVRTADVTDLVLTDAMRIAPRETLLPAAKASLAYADAEVEYAPGLYLMKPRDVGKLLHTLRAQPLERALAIAAPYAALVLETMGLDVVRTESGEDASGDFDVIITEGAVAEIPAAWFDRLGQGGRLAAVVRNGPVGKARLYVKQNGALGSREVFDATPPYLPGHAPKPQFAF